MCLSAYSLLASYQRLETIGEGQRGESIGWSRRAARRAHTDSVTVDSRILSECFAVLSAALSLLSAHPTSCDGAWWAPALHPHRTPSLREDLSAGRIDRHERRGILLSARVLSKAVQGKLHHVCHLSPRFAAR